MFHAQYALTVKKTWNKESSRGIGRISRAFAQQEERRMLVLSRKKEGQIVINDDILVTVVGIQGDTVRLGIDAPRNIPVHRKEVHTAIMLEEAQKQSNEESESTCSP
jgi:carbon storage regulator